MHLFAQSSDADPNVLDRIDKHFRYVLSQICLVFEIIDRGHNFCLFSFSKQSCRASIFLFLFRPRWPNNGQSYGEGAAFALLAFDVD